MRGDMNISSVKQAIEVKSCDVGSLPCQVEPDKLQNGAETYAGDRESDVAKSFEQTIVKAFLDKLEAGISIPAFPQLRNMNEMFLSIFQGLEKWKQGYVEADELSLKPDHDKLPEVAAIKRNGKIISEQYGSCFQLRICVTGPYTLASFFPYRNNQTYTRLSRVLSEVIEKNSFADNQGEVSLVSIDEPVFGLISDPMMDEGSEGRENLLAAWESMAHKAAVKNVESCIHLHDTSDNLFWNVKSIRIVESHVDDPLYQMKATKRCLEQEDKLLKASIAVTDFDQLIHRKLGSQASGDTVANAWKHILKQTLDPETFLESVDIMKKRLTKAFERFGGERVTLAGPECGLRGFPTYASAIECLRRVSKAVTSVQQ